MKVLANYDTDKIVEDVAVQSREPFRHELSRLLNCPPDNDSLQLFARAHPDKYYQALSNLSKMAGYKDEVVSGDTNIYMQINQLPDSSLIEKLEQTLKSINEFGNEKLVNVIEQEKAPVKALNVTAGDN